VVLGTRAGTLDAVVVPVHKAKEQSRVGTALRGVGMGVCLPELVAETRSRKDWPHLEREVGPVVVQVSVSTSVLAG
jgi:hypothetical protein